MRTLAIVSAVLVSTAVIAAILYHWLIPTLKEAGITGRDVNKPDRPEVPEMGGVALVAAFVLGLLAIVALSEAQVFVPPVDTKLLLGALSSILIIAIIGILDYWYRFRKWLKLLLPIFATFPLMAIHAGGTAIGLFGLGELEIGPAYTLVLLPLGMTGAANAVNILGGFNGLETGLGLIGTLALAVVTWITGQYTACVLLICAIGPLVVTLYWNRYPSRVFIGDVGTLTIGALWCVGSVLGHCELAGVIVVLPYAIDFAIKVKHRLPSKNWWGEFRNGKLYCPENGPVGLCQMVMKLSGGISEVGLVRCLYLAGSISAFLAVALYLV